MDFCDNNCVKKTQAVGSFSSRVYGWMTLGLSITAFTAFSLFFSGLYLRLAPFWWLWSIGTLIISLSINAKINKISVPGIVSLFLLYSFIEGLFFGSIVPAYAYSYGGTAIWAAFFTSAVVFGMAALYGTFTKQDLTGLGRILSLALVGMIVMSLVYFVLSFFVFLPLFYLLISYLGLVLFVALTVYDAQKIKQFATLYDVNSSDSHKLSMVMALKMYINVIMIFWYLLQIFSSGNRK